MDIDIASKQLNADATPASKMMNHLVAKGTTLLQNAFEEETLNTEFSRPKVNEFDVDATTPDEMTKELRSKGRCCCRMRLKKKHQTNSLLGRM